MTYTMMPDPDFDARVIATLKHPYELIARLGKHIPTQILLSVENDAITYQRGNRLAGSREVVTVTLDWREIFEPGIIATLPIDLFQELRWHVIRTVNPYIRNDGTNKTLFIKQNYDSLTVNDYISALAHAISIHRNEP